MADFQQEAQLLSELPITATPDGEITYTREDKLKAATAWLAWADREEPLRKVAEYAGVSEKLLRDWMESDWWESALNLARFKQGEKLDARLTDIINKSTAELLDRLDNGDERMTKDGDVVRVKVGGRDLAVIAAVALDKRQLLRGQPTNISRNESELSGIAEKLKQLGMRPAQVEPIAITQEGRVIEVKEKA